MNRILAFALLGSVLSPISQAIASPVTPEAALARLDVRSRAKAPTVSTSSHTVRSIPSDENPLLYLIGSDNGGFLLLPADDTAPALLGYSASGHIDNIPDNMMWWLQQYAAQVKAQASAGLKNTYTANAAEETREEIKPLMTTQWGQGAPFNNQCPTILDIPTYVGCVACATAQIVKHFEYPAQGKGSYSFDWTPLPDDTRTLSFDFGATTFEWDKMADKYDEGEYTDDQANAVATLMYGIGIGAKMSYGVNSSGASDYRVPYLLCEYLDYDPAMRLMAREWFTAAEWDRMVYENLRDVGPVYYTGTNNLGGHAFVIDGYDTDGFYHLNWGWEGLSDGYFLLDALDPELQGIGGTMDGYNDNQYAIFGIQPAREGSEPVEIVALYGNMNGSVSGRTVKVTGNFSNSGIYPITMRLGAKITPADDDGSAEPIVLWSLTGADNTPAQFGYNNFSVTLPKDLADGVYKFEAVYSNDLLNEDAFPNPIYANITSPASLLLTVTDGQATVETMLHTAPGTDFNAPAEGIIGENYHVSIVLDNSEGNAICFQPVKIYTLPAGSDGSELYTLLASKNVEIAPGEKKEVNFDITIPLTYTPGDYIIAPYCLYDWLAPSKIVTFKATSGVDEMLSEGQLAFDGENVTASTAESMITVSDMTGKMVASGYGSLSIAGLPAGIYAVTDGTATLKITVR